MLLSFAIGAILGDVFFHLIPESYHAHLIEFEHSMEEAHEKVGLSIIAGVSLFIIVEMFLEKWSLPKGDDIEKLDRAEMQCETNEIDQNNNVSQDGEQLNMVNRKQDRTTKFVNNNTITSHDESLNGCQTIDSAGYLSLIANGFDNFTHGLAIGASFLVSLKVGLLTTFVIFIHEIPHEICDYAILVNSGFSRWDAVKAQSSVSLFGMLGTITSLYVKSVKTLNAKTAWILPFSAGGFLYIALVNLLPEILGHETKVENSLRQVACVILGVVFMAMIAVI